MFCSLLTRCTIPCSCHAKRHLNVQKCTVPLSCFAFLTSKCASRHNAVHFFNISTSKSALNVVWFILTWKRAPCHKGVRFFNISTSKSALSPSAFNTFDFEMCFAPQLRALFRHLNFQKWSDPGVFCTFWLGNVLCATMACNFSSLIWPDGSTPAALASLLFDPPELQIIGKTQCFATFLPFRAPGSSFFWDFLFVDLLSSSLLFSDSFHLCFSSVHHVGSLTPKLPSINICYPPPLMWSTPPINVVNPIINHPQTTIFIGAMFIIPSHGSCLCHRVSHLSYCWVSIP